MIRLYKYILIGVLAVGLFSCVKEPTSADKIQRNWQLEVYESGAGGRTNLGEQGQQLMWMFSSNASIGQNYFQISLSPEDTIFGSWEIQGDSVLIVEQMPQYFPCLLYTSDAADE